MDVPTVSVDQMRVVDQIMVEGLDVGVTRMMENAAYHVAALTRDTAPGDTIHVYCGSGNNGGDGLAAARRLHAWGFDVTVILAEEELDGIRAEERGICERFGVPLTTDPPGERPDAAVDALIGYGLDGAPRSPYDTLIEAVNDAPHVVSVDIPSGVDGDTGVALAPHVAADLTVTLALPTDGIPGCDVAGAVWVADIGVPPQVYDRFGIDARGVFGADARVRL